MSIWKEFKKTKLRQKKHDLGGLNQTPVEAEELNEKAYFLMFVLLRFLFSSINEDLEKHR